MCIQNRSSSCIANNASSVAGCDFRGQRGRLPRHWSCSSPPKWRKSQLPPLLWSTRTHRGVGESPFPAVRLELAPNAQPALGPPLERNKLFGGTDLGVRACTPRCCPSPPAPTPRSDGKNILCIDLGLCLPTPALRPARSDGQNILRGNDLSLRVPPPLGRRLECCFPTEFTDKSHPAQ